MNTGLVLLRVVVGLTMAAHGAQKLSGAFGGPGLRTLGAEFESQGLRPGHLHAALAGLAEFSTGAVLLMRRPPPPARGG